MKNSFVRFVAVCLALMTGATLASAQEQRDRSADPLGKLDPQTRYSVEMVFDSARVAGLPYGPLESKALEGISKRASGRDILLAVRKVFRTLRDARFALGSSATPDELTAAAGALRVGISTTELARLSTSRDAKTSLTVPLIVLSDLVSRGVPRDTASLAIFQLLQHRAVDDDFLGLWRSVERDIVSGADPGVALLNRVRQMPGGPPTAGPPSSGVRPEDNKA